MTKFPRYFWFLDLLQYLYDQLLAWLEDRDFKRRK